MSSKQKLTLHTEEEWGLQILLDALQSSISSSAYKITHLSPKAGFAKPWKGKGKWASGNTKLPLKTCYLFNIISLQNQPYKQKPNSNLSNPQNFCTDTFRPMYSYQQPLPCTETTSQSFLWKQGQWQEAVFPKHTAVHFDQRGNTSPTPSASDPRDKGTARQFTGIVTDARPQSATHRDSLEDPPSTVLR